MKLLIVLSRFPFPLDKGDKLRAYHQIKELSKTNEIQLFAVSDIKIKPEYIEELKPFCSSIKVVYLKKTTIFINLLKSFINNLPFQVSYFYSKKAQRELNQLIAKYTPNHIYCQLIRTSEYAKNIGSIPKTIDYMDAFSKGIERRISVSPFYLKPILRLEYDRLIKYEALVFDNFKNKTIISEQDRNFIAHSDKLQIKIITNGVDTDYFSRKEESKKFDIIFNGNMSYLPNVETAEYLVKKILPLIEKKNTSLKVLISGANPSPKVLALQSESVIVSGWVSDVRSNFNNSKILVAPMQLSIGLQNKLLEAMSMQLPCITSSIANNALKAKAGIEILIADTPEQYVDHILYLLNNPEKAKEIALNGYNYVTKNFSWTKSTQQLNEILNS